MGTQDYWEQLTSTVASLAIWEISGLIFGLLAVIFLVKENIWTWPMGILYVLVSFVVFYQEKLYADLVLHIFFLVLNVYGWVVWSKGKNTEVKSLAITNTKSTTTILLIAVSAIGIFLTGYLMSTYTDASLPYWDSTTSILSITGMWLTARKKIENWYYWLAVDILATGIYYYKGMYFYALLYFIYIGLAVAGYLEWKKYMKKQLAC
jgi:nicotinamide mononucleotide transporter